MTTHRTPTRRFATAAVAALALATVGVACNDDDEGPVTPVTPADDPLAPEDSLAPDDPMAPGDPGQPIDPDPDGPDDGLNDGLDG